MARITTSNSAPFTLTFGLERMRMHFFWDVPASDADKGVNDVHGVSAIGEIAMRYQWRLWRDVCFEKGFGG
jgi:hypothetical protein